MAGPSPAGGYGGRGGDRDVGGGDVSGSAVRQLLQEALTRDVGGTWVGWGIIYESR